jgi:hypothetical protein
MKCMLCKDRATCSIEIKGLFPQHLCDRHFGLLSPAIKDEYYFGREQLV